MASLKRMNMMALTIGIFLDIFNRSLGTVNNGDFKHDIVIDELFGETLDTRATTIKILTKAGMPLQVAMKQVGFSEEEIADAVDIKEKQQARADANLANVQAIS